MASTGACLRVDSAKHAIDARAQPVCLSLAARRNTRRPSTASWRSCAPSRGPTPSSASRSRLSLRGSPVRALAWSWPASCPNVPRHGDHPGGDEDAAGGASIRPARSCGRRDCVRCNGAGRRTHRRMLVHARGRDECAPAISTHGDDSRRACRTGREARRGVRCFGI
jgi:hypothetical protein